MYGHLLTISRYSEHNATPRGCEYCVGAPNNQDPTSGVLGLSGWDSILALLLGQTTSFLYITIEEGGNEIV